MLLLVRSPRPTIPLTADQMPASAVPFHERVWARPSHCQWLVPTGRRRRALIRLWLQESERPATLLPGFHTLESFVMQALGASARQRPWVRTAERLLRVARAWQDVTQRQPGPGLVRQLDRLIRDWQSCGAPAWTQPGDFFALTVDRYLQDLQADGLADRMSSLRALIEEVKDSRSLVSSYFQHRTDVLLVDGFQRLERIELELLAAISERCDVLVWLVGVPGQHPWTLLEHATAILKSQGSQVEVVDDPDSTPPLRAELGRSLFPLTASRPMSGAAIPGLYQLNAADAVAEVEAVARWIKDRYREAQRQGKPVRLSDFAVIIPGPAYDPLIREAFPRAGLEFNLAGRSLSVLNSRPARVLTAALDIIRDHWRAEGVLDFLRGPLVRRQLVEPGRLPELFHSRPRVRERLSLPRWEEAWQRQLDGLRTRLAGWLAGTLDLPERIFLDRDEFLASQQEALAELDRLVTSALDILRPVAQIEQALQMASNKAAPFGDLLEACLELLRKVEIDQWLAPPATEGDAAPAETAVPWVEYEKDQQAYQQWLAIATTLAAMPAQRLPLHPQGRPDLLGALYLALDSETYQIHTPDDAGVQVFEMREMRGLEFRHVFVLGLVDGAVPVVPEEGVLADRRREEPRLAEQLRLKDIEPAAIFGQIFESARETLVLSRPALAADRPTLASPFLAAVEARVALPELPPIGLVPDVRGLAGRMGKIHAAGQPVQVLWPTVGEADIETLQPLLAQVRRFKDWPGWPLQVRIEAPALLRARISERHAFSASELEHYAACPFRYFATRLLRLEEREADPSRLHYGSLIHRVLHRFYEKRRASQPPNQPLPPVSRAERQSLLDLFQEETDQLPDGLLPPELEWLVQCENGILDHFLSLIESLEGPERNFGNLRTEYEISRVLIGCDSVGRQVTITGKLDRVDVHRADPRRAIVLDYKTGRCLERPERKAKCEDGRLLQLALYGQVLALTHPELEVIAGAYVHLHHKDNQKSSSSASLVVLGTLEDKPGKNDLPFDPDAATQKALAYAGAIRDGNFGLSPHARTNYSECNSFCSLRHACRHPDGYEDRGFS